MLAEADPGDRLLGALTEWPKVELHLHLEGTIAPRTMLQLARRNRLRLPFDRPEQFVLPQRYASFGEFARFFLLAAACLRQPQDFHDVVLMLGRQLAAQRVLHAEITFTPQLYLGRGLHPQTLVDAMNIARETLLRQHGLSLRWIVDLVRSRPAPAAAIVQWAGSAQARAAGVVALGLGGPEDGHPASPFAALFAAARASGLQANPHAGEGAGADSVRQTLETLAPRRIGHGVRAIEDPRLLDELVQRDVTLDVNLTSNVRMGVVESYQGHPLPALLQAGCAVTINSDDPALFDTTLSREYRHALLDCGIGAAALAQAVRRAALASHIDEPARKALLERLDGPLARQLLQIEPLLQERIA